MASNDVAFAIKQPDYDNLVLELNQYVDKISMILKDIEMIMYNTEDSLRGEVGDAIKSKYNEYSKQTDTIIKNLLSYGEDLVKIKQSLDRNDVNLVSQFNDYIVGLNSEADKVNENKED